MVIYLDTVMGLNFLVDFLLMLGTNQLSGFPADWKRAAAAAALGGIYGGVCLIPGFHFLGNALWRLVSLGLMGTIAFGWSRSALKRCGVFLLLALALGGLASSMGRSDFPGLVLCASMLWLLCRFSFRNSVSAGEYIPLEITHEEKKLCLRALRDTGNTLRDPVTGEPVLVISAEAAGALTGLTMEQLSRPMETLAQGRIPGLRLIPYQTVGGGGLLLAKVFPDVKLGTRHQKAIVAFDTGSLGKVDGFQALTGGNV